MSNLSNLYISGSYKGLINLEDSTQPLVSQSGDINLQDGVGNNIGLKINAQTNKFTIVNNLQVDGNADFNGNVDVSGSWIHTGSIDVLGNVTVEGNVTAHTGSFDTINARVLNVTIESSSVILSSGSNQIGDEITDVQTIVGITTISGSLGVTGTQSNTGSLYVSNEISSSTIAGLGNANQFSQSVDSRLDALEGPFSTSVDFRLDSLEAYTASQDIINSGYNSFTQSIDSRFNSFTQSYELDSASFDTRITDLENFSSSLDSNFVSEVEFAAYTQSIAIEQTQQNNRLDSLEAFTASLVTNFVTDAELSAALEVVTSSLEAQIATKLDTGSFNTFSSSVHIDLNLLASTKLNASWTSSVFTPFSSSVDSRINSKLDTSTFTSFSSSVDSRLDYLESELPSVSSSFVTTINNLSSSIAVTDANQQSEINALIADTGSYARLSGGNSFTGSQIISGSLNVEGTSTYTGSLAGNVVTLGVTSLTASMDCSLGNFFTLTLPTGSNTHITATNIRPGLTVTLQVKQDVSGYGTATFDTNDFNFPRLNTPSVTPQTGVTDIATFVSFDSSALNGVLTNDLI